LLREGRGWLTTGAAHQASTDRQSCATTAAAALDLLKPECLSRLLIFACSGDDLLDDLGPGVGVLLDVFLPARRQLTLGALVELPNVRMHAQPIAEDQPPPNPRIPGANHVHLHIRIVVDEELMPWLPKMQHIAGALDVGDLRDLVLAVGHHRQDLDDGLGRERAPRRSIQCVQP